MPADVVHRELVEALLRPRLELLKGTVPAFEERGVVDVCPPPKEPLVRSLKPFFHSTVGVTHESPKKIKESVCRGNQIHPPPPPAPPTVPITATIASAIQAA